MLGWLVGCGHGMNEFVLRFLDEVSERSLSGRLVVVAVPVRCVCHGNVHTV